MTNLSKKHVLSSYFKISKTVPSSVWRSKLWVHLGTTSLKKFWIEREKDIFWSHLNVSTSHKQHETWRRHRGKGHFLLLPTCLLCPLDFCFRCPSITSSDSLWQACSLLRLMVFMCCCVVNSGRCKWVLACCVRLHCMWPKLTLCNRRQFLSKRY